MDESYARNLDQTGQHYMIDGSLIEFIVSCADLDKDDIVLEIGYGKGALTKSLAKKCKVIAIDIEEHKLDIKNVTFVHGNILELFDDLFEKHRFNKVVANIPYNISEPLMKILFKYPELDSVVLTMGKNFVDILMQTDNRLGSLANHLFDIELLKVVKPRSFSPPPRVDSAAIKLEPKIDSISKLYAQLVVLEDKKLKNALESILTDKTKRQVKELTASPLFEKKLYELSNKEFLELDELLKDI
jgi:16S rRNA A1518/A1519 N6-dimethyltransferase RsmA/KsgA/DIM1 with predicted DNA glycosylase/AP lyase activity